jgi:hypothetical protein
MSIKTRLRERGLKPFKALAKHGDIRTISRKVGGFIAEYVIGVPTDLCFSIACLAVSSVVGFFETEDKVGIENTKPIDYSDKQFVIKEFINLNNETIPVGTRKDIELLFEIKNPFTDIDLKRKYKTARIKYHPDNLLTGDRKKWDECESLYNEMLWHWFKSDEDKILNPNYPKIREKSFSFTPKFAINQMIYFNNNVAVVYGRVARQASCKFDEYLIINDELQLSYEVKEKDLKLAENIK